ncbi:MAG: formylglycine-generating enzyme family protein [Deltaproteobacteria bacterium]|nr:MAG: formylglycine-generating enzyme family protein [Deltaproteobacteria bacterium]
MTRSGITAVLVALATAAALTTGCAPEPAGPEGRLNVAVAPLALPDVVDACYELTVLNEADATVWTRSPLCATTHGDGTSALSYVGTCDATDDNGDGTAEATVVLTVLDLYGPDGADADPDPDPLGDWRNPCGAPYAPDGCRLTVPCRADADVPVDFDLTVARDARQGFFDVAVQFADLFCSAKVDCVQPTSGDPLELVHDPATGERVQTVVFALACSDGSPDGSEATSTHLYLDDLVLDCGGTLYPVDPSGGPGNLYPNGVGAPAPLVQAMAFHGREQLESGGQSADARYWNVALGLDPAFFTAGAPTCTLTTTAAASEGPLVGGVTPVGSAYPYLSVAVPLNTEAAITCTRHPIDGAAPSDGVTTAYTGLAADGSDAVAFTYVGTPTADGLDTAPIAVPVAAPSGFVQLAAGTFLMDEGGSNPHLVTITRPFWVAETEVTQSQYESVMGYNPSAYQGASYPDAADQPVERVSWWDALTYLNQRSTDESLTPCYALTGCTGAPSTSNFVCSGVTFVGLDCDGYRLPTEAEWEYAARGGTTATVYGVLADIAWYLSNSGSHTHPVALKIPNDYGLYDIIGNVWEWCWDWYAAYPAGAATDPLGAATGTYRLLRGGSYANSSGLNTAIYRLGTKLPTTHEAHLGFRAVRTAAP